MLSHSLRGMGPCWNILQPSTCAYLIYIYHINSYLTDIYNISMLKRLSKPSHLLKRQPFSMRSLPLKLFIVHGLLVLTNLSMRLSRMHFMLQQIKLMSIMKRLLTLMLTFLQCVCACVDLAHVFADTIICSATPRP